MFICPENSVQCSVFSVQETLGIGLGLGIGIASEKHSVQCSVFSVQESLRARARARNRNRNRLFFILSGEPKVHVRLL
jgi:hypothetical protein